MTAPIGPELPRKGARKQHLHRQPDFRLPPGRQRPRGPLHLTGLLDQRTAAPVEHGTRGRKHGLAAFQREGPDPELRFDLLHRIGHGGLALVQRVRSLEAIARDLPGVAEAYAVQAGREIRVIVEPERLDDTDARRLARKIRRRIEEELNYPGSIRVTVVRERRFVETAK